jgi:hypothetical protein
MSPQALVAHVSFKAAMMTPSRDILVLPRPLNYSLGDIGGLNLGNSSKSLSVHAMCVPGRKALIIALTVCFNPFRFQIDLGHQSPWTS